MHLPCDGFARDTGPVASRMGDGSSRAVATLILCEEVERPMP